MAQHPRYPEHEIIGYGNDLEGHLEMLSSLGAYITAIGVIPGEDGRLVTFDRPAFGRKPLIPSTLPQATMHREDIDPEDSLEIWLADSIADRLDMSDEIEVKVIGAAYAFGRDNHLDRHPRVYVPVLHHGIVDAEEVQPTASMHGMITVPRTTDEILKLLSQHDRTDGVRGQRNRAVTRFAIDTYKSIQ